jgi:hypothetical protein
MIKKAVLKQLQILGGSYIIGLWICAIKVMKKQEKFQTINPLPESIGS